MKLWDNALKVTLMLMVSWLLLTACEEKLNNVGKDNPDNQFKVLFKEFILPSHILIDSLKTSQVGLLVGKYTDPVFGTVTSEAYSAFKGTKSIALTASDIVFDSLVLSLKLDAYYYGKKIATPITFRVHELKEEIIQLSKKTNFSKIMYDPTLLGQGIFTLKPKKYDKLVRSDKAHLKTTDTVKIKLSKTYFQRVQDILTSTTVKNTTLNISPKTGFYGFAIVASDADKIVGITTGTGTKLSIHYHRGTKGSRYDYSLAKERYNRITSDRSGTPIARLVAGEVVNDHEMRYVQSGTGVTTEIDFQPFINFFDKEKGFSHLVFNSVALSFGDIESTSDFAPLAGLTLINTDKNSEVAPLKISGGSMATVLSDDLKSNLFLPFKKKEKHTGDYYALGTRYFQLLYDKQIKRSTARLFPSARFGNSIITRAGYSVNRFIIHRDSITLKVYYTLPK